MIAFNKSEISWNNRHYHLELPSNIAKRTDLSSNDKLVYEVVYSMLMEGNKFFKSNKSIAKQIGLSSRSVQDSIHNLKKQDIIAFDYDYKKSEPTKKNHYKPHYYPVKRYLSFFNFFVLGQPDINKSKSNRATQNNQQTKSFKHQHHYNHSKSSRTIAFEQLSDNQQNTIKDVAHKIDDSFINYPVSNDIRIIMDKYIDNQVNIDELEPAFINLKYINVVQHRDIHNQVGLLCSISTDKGLNKEIPKFKRDIIDYKKKIQVKKQHKKEQKAREDDNDYGYHF